MSRQDVINELRALGYDGPVSFTKGRLEELLAEMRVPPPQAESASTMPDTADEGAFPEEAGAPPPPGRKPKGRKESVSSEDPFIREASFETLTTDHDFQVRQDRGWYHFIAKVTNPETGEWWVEAYGGEGKHRQFRSFRPERIKRRAHNGAIVQRTSRYGKDEE